MLIFSIFVAFSCIIVVVLLPIALGVYLLRPATTGSRFANWQLVAKKHRAEITTRGWWRQRPALRLWYRDARVDITIKSRRGRESTRLTLRHSKLQFMGAVSSRVLDETRFDGAQAERITLLDDVSAASWTGWTTDGPLAARQLSPVAQLQLVQLQRAVEMAAVALVGSPGTLEIHVDTSINSYDGLQQLVRTGLTIFDQMLLADAEGIEFVEAGELRPLEAVRCTICGEDIQHELVFCRGCKTPHHKECWEYNGQCSTYACGETRFVVPRSDADATTESTGRTLDGRPDIR